MRARTISHSVASIAVRAAVATARSCAPAPFEYLSHYVCVSSKRHRFEVRLKENEKLKMYEPYWVSLWLGKAAVSAR